MADSLDTPIPGPFAALRPFARQAARNAEEHCDICAEPIGHEHRHLLDLSTRGLLCACRACVILFDSAAAGGGARRLIPTRSRYLVDFAISDAQWESLRVPVNMAFFQASSTAKRVMAFYPSPMGPTESHLTFETWQELEQRNPILRRMEQDVEALLVYRMREARDYFLTPIDECYKLVGLIRSQWRGLSGGREVWAEIERFFSDLKARATTVEGANA